MYKLIDWFDNRTGARRLLHEALYENVPYGARLRYATGSMLVFAFVTQAITGLFLWMAYSPSSQTAWESVYYIQYEMTGGWLLRGIHHFMASAMMVVLGLHLIQVIFDGAYKAPREVNYWLGLVLMQIVMGLGLTGYLLPWDQKGYWATNVATNLMTLVPFVGQDIQQVVLGGTDYGHHTLTRFFALHAGVLPALLMIFLALHIAVFRRHGLHPVIRANKPDQSFWPYQVFWDSIGCLVLLVLVLLSAIHFDVGGALSGSLTAEHRGAELMAPADRSAPYDAARPEWYFLFLFQLLKYFDGPEGSINSEFVGALVLPGLIMTVLALAPIIAWFKGGHKFNVAFLCVLIVGAGALTFIAMREDANNPSFQLAQKKAVHEAERAIELVQRRTKDDDGNASPPQMIPKDGAVSLVRNDPLMQGPVLFERHCASCHAFEGPVETPAEAEAEHLVETLRLTRFQMPVVTEATEEEPARVVRKDGKVLYEDPSLGAANLYRFASREWLEGLLDPEQISRRDVLEPEKSSDPKIAEEEDNPANYRRRIVSPYFGDTAHKDGRMAEWVKSYYGEFPAQIAKAQGALDAIAKDLKNLPQDADEAAKVEASLKEEQTKKQAELAGLKKQNDQRLADRQAIIVALSAQAQLGYQRPLEIEDSAQIERGLVLMKQTCATYCHRVGDTGQLGLAPDLTGYGSYEWMLGMVSEPTHERFYRNENDRMQSYAADLQHPERNAVKISELSMIVDWLRFDTYEPQAGRFVQPHSALDAEIAVRSARTLTAEPEPLVGQVSTVGEERTARAEALFTSNCSACHSKVDADGQGIVSKRPSAPNLEGFGSRDWLAGLLNPEKIQSRHYFGATRHKDGDMVGFVEDSLADLDEEQQENLTALIAALSAEAALPAQAEADAKAKEDGLIEKGSTALVDEFSCTDCHQWHDNENSGAPDLIGWASREWLVGMISNPTAERFYGSGNDRMPEFHSKDHPINLLSKDDLTLLARWLRGEDLSKDAD
ncbi:cytochrome b N-terminal domain-containing protein [Lignipirellula cremea]|uniref:Menaquinol-cytochrome c reductase cytochrome b subunit n=1 Tax=Lignipirellula cremea TaxID=2528010 RepID=A0A518DZK3_9BACT|nr:cytochrome b N-terminal domain-containing protein [Lignipirellula cremea]QDU97276.1 Menaquinol-cytochrome c reductase cytochrome b subunit [Lignipirellula cremea]